MMLFASIDGCYNRCTRFTIGNRSIATTNLMTDCSIADATTSCRIKRGTVRMRFKYHDG